MQNAQNPWQKRASRQVYDNSWITVTEDQVIQPGGGDGIYGTVHFKNLALGIIPLDQDLNTWLVGQWRYPLNAYSWEIPMGGGKRSIDPIVSAQRELIEETGISAGHWQELLRIHTSNSVTDELGIVYVATDLTFGDTDFDPTEQLDIRKLPFEEALQMCWDGRITDSLTLAGIYKLALQLKLLPV